METELQEDEIFYQEMYEEFCKDFSKTLLLAFSRRGVAVPINDDKSDPDYGDFRGSILTRLKQSQLSECEDGNKMTDVPLIMRFDVSCVDKKGKAPDTIIKIITTIEYIMGEERTAIEDDVWAEFNKDSEQDKKDRQRFFDLHTKLKQKRPS